jgi:hypothetical protein
MTSLQFPVVSRILFPVSIVLLFRAFPLLHRRLTGCETGCEPTLPSVPPERLGNFSRGS